MSRIAACSTLTVEECDAAIESELDLIDPQVRLTPLAVLKG